MSLAFEQALAGGWVWALPLAFLGGLVASLNPCCLALYPAVSATCCATAAATRRSKLVVSHAAAFVVGTATATTVLGVVAAAAGHAVAILGRGGRFVLAFVPIALGLHLVGWLPLPIRRRTAEGHTGGLLAAFIAGLTLSLVVGSCGTPILVGVLSFAAHEGNLAFGGLLLLVYGLGNGLPLLLLGTGAGALTRRLGVGQAHVWAERISGGLLVGLGFYLLASI